MNFQGPENLNLGKDFLGFLKRSEFKKVFDAVRVKNETEVFDIWVYCFPSNCVIQTKNQKLCPQNEISY